MYMRAYFRVTLRVWVCVCVCEMDVWVGGCMQRNKSAAKNKRTAFFCTQSKKSAEMQGLQPKRQPATDLSQAAALVAGPRTRRRSAFGRQATPQVAKKIENWKSLPNLVVILWRAPPCARVQAKKSARVQALGCNKSAGAQAIKQERRKQPNKSGTSVPGEPWAFMCDCNPWAFICCCNPWAFICAFICCCNPSCFCCCNPSCKGIRCDIPYLIHVESLGFRLWFRL